MANIGKPISEQQIKDALEKCWNKSAAAEYLHIDPSRLTRLIDKYGIDTSEYCRYTYGLTAALKSIIADYEGARTFTLEDLCEELDFACGTKWTERYKVSEVRKRWAKLQGGGSIGKAMS